MQLRTRIQGGGTRPLDKWGVDAEAKFAHLLSASTIDDDKQCTIKMDGDHATASWDNIPGSSPLSLVKVNEFQLGAR